jgi:NAD(P)-dependent dehydrogenase (short-subunit alcohol dehydrogenase family)
MIQLATSINSSMTNFPIILMTGATSGLGLDTVKQLAQRSKIDIIVGVRNLQRVHQLRKTLPKERLTILPLDLTSLASVRDFTTAVIKHLGDQQLSAMALNAGIQITTGLEKTVDGYECTFASNYLGHFLLVSLLLSKLTANATVVSTASSTHNPKDMVSRLFGFRGGFFTSAEAVVNGILDDSVSQQQQCLDRYATSKLCNILLTYYMARRIPSTQVRFFAFDPGLMPGTELARDRGIAERVAWKYILPVLRWFVPGVSSSKQSAIALSRLLIKPALTSTTGMHFDYRLQQTSTSEDSRREDLQQALYDMSVKLTGVAAGI